MQLVVVGVVDGSCGDCELLNATYIQPGLCQTGGCLWADEFTAVCGVDNLQMNFGTGTIRPAFSASGFTMNIYEGGSLGSAPYNCDLSGVVCSEISPFFGSTCDGTASTCTVTAL